MVSHDDDCSPKNSQMKLCPILLGHALCCIEEENWKGSAQARQRVGSSIACCPRLSPLRQLLGQLCLLPGPATGHQAKARVQPLMSERLFLSAASCPNEADSGHFCPTTTHTPSRRLPPAPGLLCPTNSQPGHQPAVDSVLQQVCPSVSSVACQVLDNNLL